MPSDLNYVKEKNADWLLHTLEWNAGWTDLGKQQNKWYPSYYLFLLPQSLGRAAIVEFSNSLQLGSFLERYPWQRHLC